MSTPQLQSQSLEMQKYPRGSRGSPAKGVVPLPVARVRISSSAPRKKPAFGGLFAWRTRWTARNRVSHEFARGGGGARCKATDASPSRRRCVRGFTEKISFPTLFAWRECWPLKTANPYEFAPNGRQLIKMAFSLSAFDFHFHCTNILCLYCKSWISMI